MRGYIVVKNLGGARLLGQAQKLNMLPTLGRAPLTDACAPLFCTALDLFYYRKRHSLVITSPMTRV